MLSWNTTSQVSPFQSDTLCGLEQVQVRTWAKLSCLVINQHPHLIAHLLVISVWKHGLSIESIAHHKGTARLGKKPACNFG